MCMPHYPITDSYMFESVMKNEELCKGLIETALGIEVGRILYHNTEQSLSGRLGARGVRFDVYVEGEGRVYDVEMQAGPEPYIDQRFCLYQSLMGSEILRRGEGVEAMPETHVLFLCAQDPYGDGEPVYSTELYRSPGMRRPAVGIHWTALNASAWDKVEGDAALRALLRYVSTGQPGDDALARGLDAAVEAANRSSRWQEDRMSIFATDEEKMRAERLLARWGGRAEGRAEGKAEGRIEGLAEGKAEGKAEGMAEGEAQERARYSALVDKMLDAGRVDELKRSAQDPRLLQALYAEHDL